MTVLKEVAAELIGMFVAEDVTREQARFDARETVTAGPMYGRKLFAAAGQNFSTYLRTRRLERCRLDLTSPMFASLSISEICFRWGFNGSAHFSRAFKDRYGVSPRDYRKAQAG